MRNKLFILIGILLISFTCFGCSVKKYNATIYDNVGEYLNKEFIETMKIQGVSFIDEAKTLPTDRETLILTQEAFNKAFNNTSNINVDFSRQMVVIYTYTAINQRSISLKEIDYDRKDGSLDIDLRIKRTTKRGDTCEPYQRFLVVVMDKLSVVDLDVDVD